MAERRGGNLDPIEGAVRTRTREMYMKGISVAEIAREVDVSANTIYTWVRRDGWKQEKALLSIQEEQESILTRSTQTNQILRDGFDVIVGLVASFRKTPPTLDEGLKLVKLMTELNKLKRTNEGRPTEIKSEHRIIESADVNSDIEVREIIDADPFLTSENEPKT